jgi:hypothetical protein
VIWESSGRSPFFFSDSFRGWWAVERGCTLRRGATGAEMPVAPRASKHERGRLSEIGGQMSVADGKPVEKKTRGTKRNQPGSLAKGRAETSAVPEAVRRKKLHGIDAMRRAAADTLSEKCSSITTKMASEASEEGKVPPAKFLCDLANEDKELTVVQVERVLRSLASEWTNEAEWLRVIDEAQHDDWSRLRTP